MLSNGALPRLGTIMPLKRTTWPCKRKKRSRSQCRRRFAGICVQQGKKIFLSRAEPSHPAYCGFTVGLSRTLTRSGMPVDRFQPIRNRETNRQRSMIVLISGCLQHKGSFHSV